MADLTSDEAPRETIAAVAESVVELMRTFGKAHARRLAIAEDDVEWADHMLLKCLRRDGPQRSGAVAETLRSDPSTVSRQVASLVRDGLIERRADPDDGRASLLVLTAKADEVLARSERSRLEHFEQMLADWSDAELRTFAAMLGRFSEDYDEANRRWLSDRFGSRAAHSAGERP